jgi:hypothetical protein
MELATKQDFDFLLQELRRLRDHINSLPDMIADAQNKDRCYSINQVAKITHKAHVTIQKYIQQGLIKATKDNTITHKELMNFLNPQNEAYMNK